MGSNINPPAATLLQNSSGKLPPRASHNPARRLWLSVVCITARLTVPGCIDPRKLIRLTSMKRRNMANYGLMRGLVLSRIGHAEVRRHVYLRKIVLHSYLNQREVMHGVFDVIEQLAGK